MFNFFLGIAALASLAGQSVYALPTISVKGNKFFANGQQFFLKGTPSDPLVDTNQCQLDASSMKTIGTNSIRVYHVNPWVNHDGCMKAFSNAGIYVWLDLDTFNTTVVQTAPEWTATQLVAFAQVMDVFQGYDNLGGFWIGNEVINNAGGSSAAPYVKAAVADMKMYMATKNYRQIPIGYSAADIAELRPMLQNYLACGDASTAIDFYGLNSYEWCGAATYQSSGYNNLQAISQGYNIPIFFSETGCNVGGERTFADQTAIFGPDMIDTWSGSIIYEWVQETNDYGLVTYPNGQIYSGAPTPISPDYNNLLNVWKGINPSGVAEANYNPSLSAPACPLASAGWAVNGNPALPTLGAAVVKAAAASQVISQVSVTPTHTSTPGTTPLPSLNSAPVASSLPLLSVASSGQILSSSIVTVTAGTSTTAVPAGSSTSTTSDPASQVATVTSSSGVLTVTTKNGQVVQSTTSAAASPTTSKSAGRRSAIPIFSHISESGAAAVFIIASLIGSVMFTGLS